MEGVSPGEQTGYRQHEVTARSTGPLAARNTDLVPDVVKHRHHVSHMVYGKDRVEHSPLPAVVVT